jgi:hypothetical protein
MQKRKMTKEQEASFEAKKQAMKDLINVIKGLSPEKLEELSAQMGVITCDGHPISGKNAAMLYYQTETVGKAIPTVIGGYKQWQNLGRQVIKGERSYSICAPRPASKKDDGEEGKMGFTFISIFDISQTELIQDSETSETENCKVSELVSVTV